MHHSGMAESVRHQGRIVPVTLWLLALTATGVAVLVWVIFAHVLADATPVPVADVPQPNAIVWYGKVFQSEPAFRAELAREGRTWPTWSRNHPAAAALLGSLGRRSGT